MSIICFQKSSMMNKTEVIGTYTELYKTAFEFAHTHNVKSIFCYAKKNRLIRMYNRWVYNIISYSYIGIISI